MNNYLITLFKQNNETEFHTLTAVDLDTALHLARSLLNMIIERESDIQYSEKDSKYLDCGICISEIK